MFVSFFPQPRLFFISAVLWSVLLITFWFISGSELDVGVLVLSGWPAGVVFLAGAAALLALWRRIYPQARIVFLVLAVIWAIAAFVRVAVLLFGAYAGTVVYFGVAVALLYGLWRVFRPTLLFFIVSAVVWAAIVGFFWYYSGREWGAVVGLPPLGPEEAPIIGVSVFLSAPFIWFYIYFAVGTALFYLFWRFYSPHPWMNWSILGSALILFTTYFQVQVSVAINNWYGPFYDLIQAALAKSRPVSLAEFYGYLLSFAGIAFVAVAVAVLTRFFVSHYVFRWRTAMNDFYMANWPRLRQIEGASQRVQDDTMRFATISETLGVNLIDSIMTLIAFLPVLVRLSVNVTEVPIFGEIPYALVIVGLAWSLFGTIFLAVVGIKLPGLQFRNQRVEAAYRKELVYGEDDAARADPPTVADLFSHVRRNYFRLYFHYMYFNVARIFYIQTDNIFPYIVLAPTIIAGKITLGAMNQILNAFEQVRNSLQYLVNSWTTIVELQSIYKRLRAFEATIYGEPLPDIDREYLQRKGEPAEA